MRLKLNRKPIETKKKTVRQLLMERKINPETVLVKKGSNLIPDNTRLKSGDDLEVIKIVSGG